MIRNLHVVFTMNPSGDGLRERAATSPALFNRCVLNWFGDWDNRALYQVGVQLTAALDMARADYEPPASMARCCELLDEHERIDYPHAVINAFVRKCITALCEGYKGSRYKCGHFASAVGCVCELSCAARTQCGCARQHFYGVRHRLMPRLIVLLTTRRLSI